MAFNYCDGAQLGVRSKQRHKVVLPKYLTLVVASGTAAYLGIQFLSHALRHQSIAGQADSGDAAVLRQLRGAARCSSSSRTEGSGEAGDRTRTPPRLASSALVFAMLVGVEVYGLRTSHLFSQEIWFPVGWKRFTKYTGSFLALAAPLLLLVRPGLRRRSSPALLLALTAVSVGPCRCWRRLSF